MLRIFAVIFISSLFGFLALARPEILVPNEVEISQRETLRLSDVALVKNGSEQLVQLLEKIVIKEDARELLLSQFMVSSDIMLKLRQEMKQNEALKNLNPVLKVPSKIKVTFASTPISKQEVERQILNHLQARCYDCDYKVNVQSTPYPANKHWDLDYSQLTAKGGFLIPVRDGDSRNIKWISGNIRVSRLTPVATRLILQGERIQSSDIQLAKLDVTFAKDASIGLTDIEGQLASRTISLGSPIWTSDIKREPAAKKGQILKALIGDESFEVAVDVQAEEAGFVGDTIKVKNLETQKLLSGQIMEKGVVKLQ